jgi:hypothetical protein
MERGSDDQRDIKDGSAPEPIGEPANDQSSARRSDDLGGGGLADLLCPASSTIRASSNATNPSEALSTSGSLASLAYHTILRSRRSRTRACRRWEARYTCRAISRSALANRVSSCFL